LLRLVATFFHGQPRFALLVAIEKPFLHASTHAPTLPFAGVVLNGQGIPAARARLSTDRPLTRLRRRADHLTQMFLRPF